ncbi:MAG: bifunctional pyr operon transcriptional regulator/uracil phosphoribosyltransferase PyrR [bacterium]|nr:bifunctional pyr operon transcriptional regulator/uracil phosphoribosyltransferase PyrR [bacterium]
MCEHNEPETTVVLDAAGVGEAILRMAQEIVSTHEDLHSLVLLGVLSRGRPLADRLAEAIGQLTGVQPRVGSLSTTLYRDDLRSGRASGISGEGGTHFEFDVDGTTVLLIDDVLSTGRTVRAAMDEIMDYGRPHRIMLVCLVDRGLRELPIQADYLGWSLATGADDHVSVRLKEADGEDAVLLERASTIDAPAEPQEKGDE